MLFTFPSRYCSSIGHQGVFGLGRWASLLHTGFLVSRATPDYGFPFLLFRLQDSHLLRSAFPDGSAREFRVLHAAPLPPLFDLHLITGLGSSSFARHYSRNRSFFLFLRVLRCFSSPGSPPCPMCSDMDTRTLLRVGSPIRISTGHCLLAAHRSFSQLATSFLGSWCLGIHPMLFVA